jgi:hypothetical protein
VGFPDKITEADIAEHLIMFSSSDSYYIFRDLATRCEKHRFLLFVHWSNHPFDSLPFVPDRNEFALIQVRELLARKK